MLPFAGEVTFWAGEINGETEKKLEQGGWLVCDGRALPRNKYPDLFTVIGNKYSHGQIAIPENFFLPDFGGRGPIGPNSASSANKNKLSVRAVGEIVGEEAHKLTVPEMPSHSHSTQGYTGTDAGRNDRRDGLFGATNSGTGSAGSDQPHNNMQPSLVVTALIRFKAG